MNAYHDIKSEIANLKNYIKRTMCNSDNPSQHVEDLQSVRVEVQGLLNELDELIKRHGQK